MPQPRTESPATAPLASTWPMGYDRARTLGISTIGRRTGKIHTKTIQFAVDETGRLYIATKDTKRDWVKNAKKNPSVDVRIGSTTRSMLALSLTSDSDKNHVRSSTEGNIS